MHDAHRFHAVLHAVGAGEKGIRRGELARRFRGRALRLPPAALASLLDELVRRQILRREPDGRTERYRPGPDVHAFLGAVHLPAGSGVRYRAEQVSRLIRFLVPCEQESPAAARPDLVAAVKTLGERTATGLVSLSELRRMTGLGRDEMHEAVRHHVAEGVLMLHPMAARHQVSDAEMQDGIRTPGGQNLFYVELVS